MRHEATSLLVVLAVTLPAARGAARDNADAPVAEPTERREAPGGEDVTITATSVRPIVEQLPPGAEGAAWKPVREGDELAGTTVIRTGLGARVVLKVADRGHITVESGTKVGLDELVMTGDVLNVKMGLKYGGMDARLPHAAGRSDMHVVTPVATLATRGCGARVRFDGDRGLHFYSHESTWGVGTNFGRTRVAAGESTDGALTPSIFLMLGGRNTNMGDPFGGLTNLEQRNLLWHGRGRGIFGFTGGGNGQNGALNDHTSDSCGSERNGEYITKQE